MDRGTGSTRPMLGDSCLFPSARRVYSSSTSDLTPIFPTRHGSEHMVGEQHQERVKNEELGTVSGSSQQRLDPRVGGLQQGLDPILGGLPHGLDPLLGGLQQDLDPLLGGLQQGLDSILGGLQQGLEPILGGLPHGLDPLLGGLQHGLDPILGGSQQGLDPILGGSQQGLDSILGGLQHGLDPLLGGLQQGLDPILGGSQQGMDPISGGLQQGPDPILGGLQQGPDPILGGLQQGPDPILGGLQQGLDPILGGSQQGLNPRVGGLQHSLNQFEVGLEEEQSLMEGQISRDIERGPRNVERGYTPKLDLLTITCKSPPVLGQLDLGQSSVHTEESKSNGYATYSEGDQEKLPVDDSSDITSVDSATFSSSPDIYNTNSLDELPQMLHRNAQTGYGVKTDSWKMAKCHLLKGRSEGPRSPDSGLPSESDQGRTYVSVVEGLCAGGQVLFYHKQVGTCTVPLIPLQNLRIERSEFEIQLSATHQGRGKDGLHTNFYTDRRLVTKDNGHASPNQYSPASYGLIVTASPQTAPILMAVDKRMVTAGDRSAEWRHHVAERSVNMQGDRQTVATYRASTEGNLDIEVETIMNNRELFSFKAKEIAEVLERRMVLGLNNIPDLTETGSCDTTQGGINDSVQELRARLQTEIESFSSKIAFLSTTTSASDQKGALLSHALTSVKVRKQELDENQQELELGEVTESLEDLTRQLESEMAEKTYLQQKLEETASLLEAQRQDLDDQATTIADLQAHRRHLEEHIDIIMQWLPR